MKRWFIITSLSILLISISICIYIYHLYDSIKSTADMMYEPIKLIDPIDSKHMQASIDLSMTAPAELMPQKSQGVDSNAVPAANDSFSVLLLGIDNEQGYSGRSDVIILMTINPHKRTILFFNIPRDTYTEIYSLGFKDKINHAYAYGGASISLKTVESFLQIPIQYYVKVNMQGFSSIIDILGGIEVDNPLVFHINHDDQQYVFNKGNIFLDGEAALSYSRMRYDDPRGDLGRNERQRQVLRGIIQAGKNPLVFSKSSQILENLADHVKTNITFKEMQFFALHYREVNNMESIEVTGKGKMINDIYYYIVDQAEKDRIHDILIEFMMDLP